MRLDCLTFSETLDCSRERERETVLHDVDLERDLSLDEQLSEIAGQRREKEGFTILLLGLGKDFRP